MAVNTITKHIHKQQGSTLLDALKEQSNSRNSSRQAEQSRRIFPLPLYYVASCDAVLTCPHHVEFRNIYSTHAVPTECRRMVQCVHSFAVITGEARAIHSRSVHTSPQMLTLEGRLLPASRDGHGRLLFASGSKGQPARIRRNGRST